MARIVIIGGPKVGKSTLAEAMAYSLGYPVRGTDDLMHLPWSEASHAASLWLEEPGPFILEGVAMVRAIRKWIVREDNLPPFLLIYLKHPHEELAPRQIAMAKGIDTIWQEIRSKVEGIGCTIIEGNI